MAFAEIRVAGFAAGGAAREVSLGVGAATRRWLPAWARNNRELSTGTSGTCLTGAGIEPGTLASGLSEARRSYFSLPHDSSAKCAGHGPHCAKLWSRAALWSRVALWSRHSRAACGHAPRTLVVTRSIVVSQSCIVVATSYCGHAPHCFQLSPCIHVQLCGHTMHRGHVPYCGHVPHCSRLGYLGQTELAT